MGNTHSVEYVYMQPTKEQQLANIKTKISQLETANNMVHAQFNSVLAVDQSNVEATNRALQANFTFVLQHYHNEAAKAKEEKEAKLASIHQKETFLRQQSEILQSREAQYRRLKMEAEGRRDGLTTELNTMKENKDARNIQLREEIRTLKERYALNDKMVQETLNAFAAGVSGDPAIASTIKLLCKLNQLPYNINKNIIVLDQMDTYIDNLIHKIRPIVDMCQEVLNNQRLQMSSSDTVEWARKKIGWAAESIEETGFSFADLSFATEEEIQQEILVKGKSMTPFQLRLFDRAFSEVKTVSGDVPAEIRSRAGVIIQELAPVLAWRQEALSVSGQTDSMNQIDN